MTRRFPNTPDHLREPHEVEIAGTGRVYAIAITVAIAIGLVSGLVWLGWLFLTR